MSQFNTLSVEQNENLAWVQVDRPDKLNALNDQVLTELYDLFSDFYDQDNLRGVFITGSGDKAFVAGADIGELKELDQNTGKEASEKGKRVFQLIEDMRVPVIGVVNGYALGGGAELAMACHLRVASENAVFGLPEVGLGLIPGYGGTQRLPKLVGRTRALEMILTGEPIEAQQALDYGLVNRVVAREELKQTARGLMNAITNNAPLAIRHALQAVLEADESQESYEQESDRFGKLCQSDDAKEGLSAFLEKRKADFKGE